MALQLLKRNYTMQGYEKPKILKLPQGEMRWTPRRLPVDIGDVYMNMRMDDSKTRYIGESVTKYAKGTNPYGQWGYPYKVNKQFRPPIVDPKYNEPLSRMPVKFDAITAGPIVKDLYGKKIDIAQVAPRTITDKICVDAPSNLSMRGHNYTDNTYHEGEIELKLKQPHASIPYMPSMPDYRNTGVPEMELDSKLMTRAHAGIHGPFNISDQSRDVLNMRTPMHVALSAGYKDPYTKIEIDEADVSSLIRDTPLHTTQQTQLKSLFTADPVLKPDYSETLTPKIQTSAWYNPSYYLTDSALSVKNYVPTDMSSIREELTHTQTQSNPSYRLISDHTLQNDLSIQSHIDDKIQTSATSSVSWIPQRLEIGEARLPDTLPTQEFQAKPSIGYIDNHPEYERTRKTQSKEYFFIGQNKVEGDRATNDLSTHHVRSRLKLQDHDQSRNINYIEDVNDLARSVETIRNGRFISHRL
jgi:hypothetical protein